jgi:hypothetical protein
MRARQELQSHPSSRINKIRERAEILAEGRGQSPHRAGLAIRRPGRGGRMVELGVHAANGAHCRAAALTHPPPCKAREVITNTHTPAPTQGGPHATRTARYRTAWLQTRSRTRPASDSAYHLASHRVLVVALAFLRVCFHQKATNHFRAIRFVDSEPLASRISQHVLIRGDDLWLYASQLVTRTRSDPEGHVHFAVFLSPGGPFHVATVSLNACVDAKGNWALAGHIKDPAGPC